MESAKANKKQRVPDSKPAVPAVEKYRDVREEFRTGDILCFAGHSMFSKAIRRMTQSVYSHAGLVFRYDKNVYVLESVGVGVRLALMSDVVKNYHGGIDYYSVPDVTGEQRQAAVNFAFRKLGKQYDKKGIIRFFFYILRGEKHQGKVKEKAVEEDKDDLWFCSELVAEAWRRAGHPLAPTQAAYTTPSQIADGCLFRWVVKPNIE